MWKYRWREGEIHNAKSDFRNVLEHWGNIVREDRMAWRTVQELLENRSCHSPGSVTAIQTTELFSNKKRALSVSNSTILCTDPVFIPLPYL